MSDEIRLSTGRRFYANHLILGLQWLNDGDPPGGELFEGYDGSVEEAWPEPEPGYRTAPPFTGEERQEIAEHMIARWREWAARGSGRRGTP